jgi:exopolysaccharide biosynthesis polyprenyl glycosylphosphotransferase
MDFISHLIRLKIFPYLKKWKLLNFLLGTTDILAIALAYQCSYSMNYSHIGGFFFTQKNLLFLFMGILPLWLLVLYLLKIAEIPRTKRYRALFFEYLLSSLAILLIFVLFNFVFKLHQISRLFLIEFTFFGLKLLFFVRILEYEVFKKYRAKGFNYVNIVLLADDSSVPFIESLLFHKEWGYRIAAIFTGSTLIKEKYEETIIILPEKQIPILNDLMEVNIIDEVLYIKSKVISSEVRTVVRSCEELGVIFRLIYKDSHINLSNAVKTEIGNEIFLTFTNIPHNSYAMTVKKIIDIFVSLLMIVALFPVFIIISVSIKLTSWGPIIYKQPRVGLRGRQFDLYKFRTMVFNAEILRKELEAENEADGPAFKIQDDPRVTKTGKFLRKTGLDELPQLFNIIKGEMSLIGPRPPLSVETLQYKRWQLRRLSVKPGLSCFWQIKPERNKIKFEKWMELDLAYIDNWSLRLDFVIFLKTIKTVFQRTGL